MSPKGRRLSASETRDHSPPFSPNSEHFGSIIVRRQKKFGVTTDWTFQTDDRVKQVEIAKMKTENNLKGVPAEKAISQIMKQQLRVVDIHPMSHTEVS